MIGNLHADILSHVKTPGIVQSKLQDLLRGMAGTERDAILARMEADLKKQEGAISASREHCLLSIAVLREVSEWLEGGDLKIELAQSSRVHDMISAIKDGKRCVTYNQNIPDPLDRLQFVNAFQHGEQAGQVFIVEHDWGAAFTGADDYDDASKFMLPYDRCTFEFCVRGRRVIVHAVMTEPDDFVMAMHFELKASLRHGWFAIDMQDEAFADISEIMVRQVRAICVSLEAEITTTDPIRIPDKLRKARERDGKLPPFDHHVVRLNRRPRAAALEAPAGTGTRKRLHFRRGHWRHYAEHRTWIKWTLCGNPDLGFVDKEYRL